MLFLFVTAFAPEKALNNTMTDIKGKEIIDDTEKQRLDALYKYDILYTSPEESFDNITQIMATVFEMPMAFISLVDHHNVFYKSQAGPFGRESVSRTDSLCSITILKSEPTVFEDTGSYDTLVNNPLVKVKGGIKFYAGAPLITADGQHIGAVCIVDTKPRKFAEEKKQLLVRFAKMVMHEIELRRAAKSEAVDLQKKVEESLKELEQFKVDKQAYNLFMKAPVAISIYKGPEHIVELSNDTALRLAGKTPEVIGKSIREVIPEIEAQGFIGLLDSVLETGRPFNAFEAPITLHTHGKEEHLYLNFIYQPYYDLNGNITGVLAFAVDVTEQVLARKKVEESEQRFRNVLEQAPDPIFILKGNDLVLDVANDPLFKLWNVGKEALGKPFLEILPEMKDQGFYDLLQDVLQNGVTHYGHEMPVYLIRSNGLKETIYFNFVYQPFREADGKVTGVLVLASDVSEQVLAKQKVLESEKNFRTLVMQAPIGICMLIGEDFLVEEANESYLQLAGKQRQNFVGRPLWEGLPEAKNQGFDALLEQVLKTGIAYTGKEYPVTIDRAGEKEALFIDFVYEPLKEDDGTIKRIMVLAINVTDKVIARKEIEYSEERARLAIDSAELGTFEVNLMTDEIVSSIRMDSIFGLSGSVDRNRFISSIHPDDIVARDSAYRQAYQTGRLEYESRVIWNDGTVHWVRIKGRLFLDEKRTPVRLLGVAQDISEQKLFAEELEKQVEDRTKELSIANEELQKLNVELEQFAYAASHDMQEPLRKVQTFSTMLLQNNLDQFDERGKNYLNKIASSVARMKAIIEDLLKYSQHTRENKDFVSTDLNKILENIEADLELNIAEKDAVILKKPLPDIEAIPTQINQLFYNIITNALKFGKPGVPVEIRVSARELLPDDVKKRMILNWEKKYVELRFTDNGIGFEQEYAEKIFSLFKRLHGRSEFEGTGIGLALCKKIIHNHNGDIYATSVPDEGTTFYVILPVSQQ
ncbi:MAG: hypothetical protein JWQ40_1964 [Segetibacter sp.]|nr:hypothetical protein [Segetibacter sp.]